MSLRQLLPPLRAEKGDRVTGQEDGRTAGDRLQGRRVVERKEGYDGAARCFSGYGPDRTTSRTAKA